MFPFFSFLLHKQIAIDRAIAKCYCPVMDIKTFAQALTADQRQKLVKLAGTNTAYFSQISNGHRQASSDLARELVRASKQLFPDDDERWLTLHGVRPDIWKQDEAA